MQLKEARIYGETSSKEKLNIQGKYLNMNLSHGNMLGKESGFWWHDEIFLFCCLQSEKRKDFDENDFSFA